MQINHRFDEESSQINGQVATPNGPRPDNFYFAQLEEIEQYHLKTIYVDFQNLQDFAVNGETGVLAQAIAEQYYR